MKQLIFVFCFWWTQAALADSFSVLANLLKPYQVFSAEFEQSSLDASGSPVSRMTGQLAIDGKTRFFWQTNPPFAQTIVADGDVLWIFDEDLLQVQVRPLNDALSTSPSSILGGSAENLAESFSVTEERGGTRREFSLIPKAEDDVTREILLRFDGSRLMELLVRDALGNQTRIKLTAISRDPPNNQRFVFEPPPGVDVIYGLGQTQ
ncbi:outer membrane lipoprotein chaperone LolA [Litorivicinus sp.]|nr:outer membrane lipoprotein chaperone LolA [Litorivicinus sp.]